MSSITPTHFCIIESKGAKFPPFKCELSQDKATTICTAIIALAFIATGVYLYFGGIGTIPSQTGGIGLLAGGGALLILALFSNF